MIFLSVSVALKDVPPVARSALGQVSSFPCRVTLFVNVYVNLRTGMEVRTDLSILPKQVRWKDHVRMKLWAWDEKNLPSITHAIRTAVAATVSVIIARLVQMPEAYWAAIATLVVMQSTLGATLTLSIERIVATAVGASVGALEANFFGANLVAFALAIVLHRIALDRVSFGENCVSLREHHPRDHRSHSAHGCTVDHRAAQIP